MAITLFFLYVETKIVISKNVSLLEKLFSFVCFAMIEMYYVMQLIERF